MRRDDRRRIDRRWGRMRTEIAPRSAASERTMMWWDPTRATSKSRAGCSRGTEEEEEEEAEAKLEARKSSPAAHTVHAPQ